MRKSLNDHLDTIEKQTVEEMVSVEQNLQVKLKKVLDAIDLFLCAQWPSMTWHFLLPQEWDVILGNGDDHLLCT
jgi:hypothetical protein